LFIRQIQEKAANLAIMPIGLTASKKPARVFTTGIPSLAD
jgi:hypothetical protein